MHTGIHHTTQRILARFVPLCGASYDLPARMIPALSCPSQLVVVDVRTRLLRKSNSGYAPLRPIELACIRLLKPCLEEVEGGVSLRIAIVLEQNKSFREAVITYISHLVCLPDVQKRRISSSLCSATCEHCWDLTADCTLRSKKNPVACLQVTKRELKSWKSVRSRYVHCELRSVLSPCRFPFGSTRWRFLPAGQQPWFGPPWRSERLTRTRHKVDSCHATIVHRAILPKSHVRDVLYNRSFFPASIRNPKKNSFDGAPFGPNDRASGR